MAIFRRTFTCLNQMVSCLNARKEWFISFMNLFMGLKQASTSWNVRFDQVIQSLAFEQNPEELCVYKRSESKLVIFLVLYVDDILLIRNNIGMLSQVKV